MYLICGDLKSIVFIRFIWFENRLIILNNTQVILMTCDREFANNKPPLLPDKWVNVAPKRGAKAAVFGLRSEF